MSMYLNFEPHSWYKGWAIKKSPQMMYGGILNHWQAFTDDGNTYRIIELEAVTLADLKRQINEKIDKLNKRMAENYAEMERTK